ncbi:AI-2E family transporter [Kocuria indica]|uniref:AI-2E family transporter n=1 Tax=Kocuria marina TaxID=223184 RepID=UPI001EF3E197|nr:AI-2E family transporter [Kocuria indica]
MADQWDSLMVAAQQGWQTLQDASARLPFTIDEAAMQQIWSRVQGVAPGGAVEQSALTGTVLMVIVLFFFLQDAERIGGFLLSWFPPRHTEELRRTDRDTVRTLGGYVRGTAAVAVIEMLAIAVGCGCSVCRSRPR